MRYSMNFWNFVKFVIFLHKNCMPSYITYQQHKIKYQVISKSNKKTIDFEECKLSQNILKFYFFLCNKIILIITGAIASDHLNHFNKFKILKMLHFSPIKFLEFEKQHKNTKKIKFFQKSNYNLIYMQKTAIFDSCVREWFVLKHFISNNLYV
ncbi:hypothetical protein EDEG_01230 [Edhazardia aedis USNM 41457]|uniref:Uncharacterized protein n=1 Tax=Edhazardia aedis (strain USNM 41457) TaxID=1003232 RepID=J9DTF8_EDHAE|nr:hypothetical protein EDEG_01230 [Edhazardia aedis USNM 41457]|eukprot:EJW04547.1 hypothetical protein EDEG_01230 [Edhazardia aedis USNM 41457]